MITIMITVCGRGHIEVLILNSADLDVAMCWKSVVSVTLAQVFTVTEDTAAQTISMLPHGQTLTDGGQHTQ